MIAIKSAVNATLSHCNPPKCFVNKVTGNVFIKVIPTSGA